MPLHEPITFLTLLSCLSAIMHFNNDYILKCNHVLTAATIVAVVETLVFAPSSIWEMALLDGRKLRIVTGDSLSN